MGAALCCSMGGFALENQLLYQHFRMALMSLSSTLACIKHSIVQGHAVSRSCEEIRLQSLSQDVKLGLWDMLQMLGLPCLSVHRKYLKLTTTYYIVSHMYYPLVSLYKVLYLTFNCTSTFNFITLLHILITYTILMLIKHKIQFSARNSILTIYGRQETEFPGNRLSQTNAEYSPECLEHESAEVYT